MWDAVVLVLWSCGSCGAGGEVGEKAGVVKDNAGGLAFRTASGGGGAGGDG
jgi:hypothetical protein